MTVAKSNQSSRLENYLLDKLHYQRHLMLSILIYSTPTSNRTLTGSHRSTTFTPMSLRITTVKTPTLSYTPNYRLQRINAGARNVAPSGELYTEVQKR